MAVWLKAEEGVVLLVVVGVVHEDVEHHATEELAGIAQVGAVPRHANTSEQARQRGVGADRPASIRCSAVEMGSDASTLATTSPSCWAISCLAMAPPHEAGTRSRTWTRPARQNGRRSRRRGTPSGTSDPAWRRATRRARRASLIIPCAGGWPCWREPSSGPRPQRSRAAGRAPRLRARPAPAPPGLPRGKPGWKAHHRAR